MRYFVLIIGISFVLAGVGGFVPLVTTPVSADAPPLALNTSYGLLLGLFPINIAHNLIHLSLGIWGLLAYRSLSTAHRYCQILAVTLTVFVILGVGVIPQSATTFGLIPMFGHDVWLHGLEAIIAGYFGFVANRNPLRLSETPAK